MLTLTECERNVLLLLKLGIRVGDNFPRTGLDRKRTDTKRVDSNYGNCFHPLTSSVKPFPPTKAALRSSMRQSRALCDVEVPREERASPRMAPEVPFKKVEQFPSLQEGEGGGGGVEGDNQRMRE